MRVFYLHFSRNKDGAIFSKMLQWYEGVPISHILVEFEAASLGQPFIYHSAIGNGVSFITKKRFEQHNEIMETYKIELPDHTYVEMRNKLLDNCGERYAMWQNLGIFLVDLARKACSIRIKNPWKNGQNCSELVYRYVVPYICNNIEEILPDLVKPSDIRRILKTNNINALVSKVI